jgi:superfamily II DNA/RNA helicase
LDVVVVVGSALGPDEYTHIAGRTGRAGREGKVINVLSQKQTAAVTGWEKMLGIEFQRLEVDDVASLD